MLSKKAKRSVVMKHCGAHKQDGKGGAISEAGETIKNYGAAKLGDAKNFFRKRRLVSALESNLPGGGYPLMGDKNMQTAEKEIKSKINKQDMVGARKYVEGQVFKAHEQDPSNAYVIEQIDKIIQKRNKNK